MCKTPGQSYSQSWQIRWEQILASRSCIQFDGCEDFSNFPVKYSVLISVCHQSKSGRDKAPKNTNLNFQLESHQHHTGFIVVLHQLRILCSTSETFLLLEVFHEIFQMLQKWPNFKRETLEVQRSAGQSSATLTYLAQAILPEASGKFLGIGGLEDCFLKNFAILSISLLNVFIILKQKSGRSI